MTKNEAKVWKDPCGCKVNHTQYVEMCPKHRKEHDEIAARWAEDYKRTAPLFEAQCENPMDNLS